MSERPTQRLLRWYPQRWRQRYGEEFAALLEAEIAERPRSLRRGVNVRWHGVKMRLAGRGLGAQSFRDAGAAQATRWTAVAVFLASATSLWGHVLSRSSTAPTAHPPVVGIRVVVGVTFGVLAVRSIVGAASLSRRTVTAIRATGVGPLAPALLSIGAGALAFAGALIAVWSYLHEGVTFASVTRITTFSLSNEWRYVTRLPHPVLAWMVISPLAFTAIVAGIARLQRLLQTPRRRRVWPWQASLLVPTLAVNAWWAIGSQDYRDPLLRAGGVDLALMAVMAICLLVAAAAERDTAELT